MRLVELEEPYWEELLAGERETGQEREAEDRSDRHCGEDDQRADGSRQSGGGGREEHREDRQIR